MYLFNRQEECPRTISVASFWVRSKWVKWSGSWLIHQVGLLLKATSKALSAQVYLHFLSTSILRSSISPGIATLSGVVNDWMTSEARHSRLYCKLTLVISWVSKSDDGTLCQPVGQTHQLKVVYIGSSWNHPISPFKSIETVEIRTLQLMECIRRLQSPAYIFRMEIHIYMVTLRSKVPPSSNLCTSHCWRADSYPSHCDGAATNRLSEVVNIKSTLGSIFTVNLAMNKHDNSIKKDVS